MKYSRPLALAFISIATVVIAATTTLAEDLRSRFDAISVGMTRAAVLAVMPPPAAAVDSSWLGIPYGQLKWSERVRGAVFTVSFVGDRVYAKTACDRATDC